MKKLLTIIIPAYNMEQYLSKCLNSLIIEDKKLFQKLDIIIVNDGSKDQTSKIGHEYESRHPEVFRVIDKKNGHYGSCVNVGLLNAQGEYIRILDADDYVITSSFEKYCRIAEEEASKGKDGADMLISSYQSVTPDGTIEEVIDYGLQEKCNYYTLDNMPENSPRFTVHSITYRTELLRKMNYQQTEGMNYTDTEWIIEPMTRIRRFRFISDIVVCYLLGRNGQSMDPLVFSRDFSKVAQITIGLTKRFQQHSLHCEKESHLYYQRQIEKMIKLIYYWWYKGFQGHKCNINILDFDRQISEEPLFYNVSDRFFFKTGNYKYYYIHSFRQWHTRYSPMWLVYSAHRAFNYISRLMDLSK